MERQTLADYRKAGRIVAEALAYGKRLVQVDANILEICLAAEEKIRQLGAQPAFPAQVSINHVAAHWCPDPGDAATFQEGQLVKLDIGCHINGHVADTAVSIDLSDDKRHAPLIAAAEDARDAVLRLATPGRTLGEIGAAIQHVITDAGFTPIQNLSGHGLGRYDVHTWPSIPNVDTKDATELEDGMAIAIEPFATTGQGKVYEQEHGNIYSLLQAKPVRSRYARQALALIEQYEGLPFSLHWIAARMGAGPARFAMRELLHVEAVRAYPPLPETSGAPVSQAEHSVIVADTPIVYTRPE